MDIRKTVVWRFFSSIKLAIWLLAVIASVSLIGTFIPQTESAAFYTERFGSAGYGFLLKTGLTNIYSAWFFILLLALLALNLIVCLANRLPVKLGGLGTFISHLSILVILLGALIGIIYGEKGLIKICKGGVVRSFISKGRPIDLGFSIRLDDFIYTEHIDPKERLLVYSVTDRGKGDMADTAHSMPKDACYEDGGKSTAGKGRLPIAELSTETGRESAIGNTGYRIKVLRYLNDFAMDVVTKTTSNRSAEPNNPAIEVQLLDKAGELRRFWVFARFPDMHQKADLNFKFIYCWAARRPKDFISKVTLLKGPEEIKSEDIRVNEPLSFGGYRIFQSTYDAENLSWSGLQVVKDPGVGVVYTGFLLLIAGVTAIFYVNPAVRRR